MYEIIPQSNWSVFKPLLHQWTKGDNVGQFLNPSSWTRLKNPKNYRLLWIHRLPELPLNTFRVHFSLHPGYGHSNTVAKFYTSCSTHTKGRYCSALACLNIKLWALSPMKSSSCSWFSASAWPSSVHIGASWLRITVLLHSLESLNTLR